jgi:hypothetical protein
MKPNTLYHYLQVYDSFRKVTRKWTDHERRMLFEAAFRSGGIYFAEGEQGEIVVAGLCYTTDNPAPRADKNVMVRPGHFLYVAHAWGIQLDRLALLHLRAEALQDFHECSHMAYHRHGKLVVYEVKRGTQTQLQELEPGLLDARYLQRLQPGANGGDRRLQPPGLRGILEDQP